MQCLLQAREDPGWYFRFNLLLSSHLRFINMYTQSTNMLLKVARLSIEERFAVVPH